MRFFYFFFFVSICSSILFGQYTIDDKELARTTFAREFNKAVFNEYLNSGVDKNINAALLSLSNSIDTTFIPQVLKLDDKYLTLISFALGQLGQNKLSEDYLLSKINSATPLIKHSIVSDLGKIISKPVFDSLIENYTENNFVDISHLIANYHLRGLEYDKAKTSRILVNELKGNDEQKFEALYSAYRTGLCEFFREDIVNFLKNAHFKIDSSSSPSFQQDALVYSLACLRKLKFFPNEQNIFKESLSSDAFPVLIEGIKSAAYKKNFSHNDLLAFSKLLNHKNINIAVQAASSIKDVVVNENFFDFLLYNILNKSNDARVRGELAVSCYKLYPEQFITSWSIIKPSLNDEYIYAVYNLLPASFYSLDSLFQNYSHSSAAVKIKTLELLFNGTHNLSSPSTSKFILDVLSSPFAPAISIAADGLDSIFCKTNNKYLKNLILKQTNNYLHNVGYIESLLSLSNLAYKISNNFGKEISALLAESELYSIKKIAAAKVGVENKFLKEENYFENIWNNSFKFSSAIVTTEKGVFEIEFLPQYAPVSVGSFCYLAQLNFFRGLIFHRVVPGFVIQTGDPTGTGWGGPEYEIISEFSPLNFSTGFVGMASAGNDTEGSQWFVMQGNHPHLDGRYSIFGKIKTGIETVFNTGQGDKILKIELKY